MKRLLQRFGIIGLLFFTLKGVAWLAVPLLIARGCM
jgi:hypothetical protein